MEKPLKTVLQLSLEDIATRNVVALLWNHPTISASISRFKFDVFQLSGGKRQWVENVEDKINEKILKLELPESLKKQLSAIVKPMGLDVRRWKFSNESFVAYSRNEFGLPDSAKLHWNAAGILDYKKIAEELMQCPKFTTVQRYKIACTYCLEDWIQRCWKYLPESKKNIFSCEKHLTSDLFYCWPHILKGDFSKLDNLLRRMTGNQIPFNQFAFQHAVQVGNKIAAEYFFEKLTEVERKDSLVRTTLNMLGNHHGDPYRTTNHSNLLCYLLSFMTPEEQVEIVKAHPGKVLLCFLDWPFQDLFLENAAFIWDFLPPSGYPYLLRKMAQKFEDHYVPGLFQRFFIESPRSLKNYFANEALDLEDPPSCLLMSIFTEYGDSNSMKVIFRNVDAADRLKLVFHRLFFKIIFNCILWNKCYMVEECLQETKLSMEEKQRMKRQFREFLETLVSGECVNRKFRRFFEFLDKSDDEGKESVKASA